MAPSDPNAVGHGLLQPAPLRPSEIADAEALVARSRLEPDRGRLAGLPRLGTVQAIRAQGRVVATAATLPYGAFAWISMVLVTAAFRRHGLAARLMRGAIDDLVDAGLVPVLDATPAGREVYRKLGFADTWGFARLARPGSVPPAAMRPAGRRHHAWARSPTRIGLAFAPMTPRRSAPTAAGCSRACAAACRRRTWWRARGGRIVGFLLGRDGRIASQLGPLIADDAVVARALLARALAAIAGPIFIDLADSKTETRAWLEARGFAAAAAAHPHGAPAARRLRRRHAHVCGGRSGVRLAHDPEKWLPVFGKDHAPTNTSSRPP